MTSTSARTLTNSLGKLQITQSAKASPAESWEEEAEKEGDSLTDARSRDLSWSPRSQDGPEAPPPTPASPSVKSKATSTGSQYQTFPPYGLNGSLEAEAGSSRAVPSSSSSSSSPPPRSDGDRRPEKTMSTASRLIAAGIGQKPPRRSKEAREYDQAMKVQEKKRRDAAKEELDRKQREKEKAQLSVWED